MENVEVMAVYLNRSIIPYMHIRIYTECVSSSSIILRANDADLYNNMK